MPNSKDAFFYELALANRIVANEGIIDSFGHVSMRDPDDPNRYFLSRSRAPAAWASSARPEQHSSSG